MRAIAAPSGEATRRLAYQPALDGLRALAVLAVLLFHADVPGMGGGYLGVSVFFTLSGFLITSLLIREHRQSGTIAAGAFYARRARRLLPAAVLCLTAISALAIAGEFDLVAHLRLDLVGAALQVENWVQLAGDGSYAELFAQTGGQLSPVAHFWSLAIEEQFYWVWPVTFLALARWGARRGWPLTVTIGALALVFVIAAPIIAQVWGPDAAYWATPARVGEILTGAFAAALVAHRSAPAWTARAAPVCLLAIGIACVTFPSGSGPAYQGWLPALSVVTAVLLLGVQHDSSLRTALSWHPLVAVGTISYGLYLFHWPIFVLVDEARLGRGGVVLLAVRFALTFGVAIASYRLIERPVRTMRLATTPSLLGGLALTVFALSLVIVVPQTGITVDTAGGAADDAAIEVGADLDPLRVAEESPAVPGKDVPATEAGWRQTTLVAPTPTRPIRILVFGDSTAEALGGGLVRWAAANPSLAQVTVGAAQGCGFVQGGTRVFRGREEEIGPACDRYVDEDLSRVVGELDPDVVVAMTTTWDVIDQRFPGTGAEAPTDAGYRERIRAGLGEATESMRASGAPHVVWIAQPTVDPIWNPAPSPQEDPERHGVLHATMRELAAADPRHVAVADLAWWIDAVGLTEDRDARPDGVHLSSETSERVATEWLGPILLSAALSD